MTSIDRVQALVSTIDERSQTDAENLLYYQGRQPLAFINADARALIKLDRIAANVCRLQVNSLVERLRVNGLTLNGKPSVDLANDWSYSNLDQRLIVLLREALIFGRSFGIVWDSRGRKKPRVSVESARDMTVLRDPETGEIVEAAKRWVAGNETTVIHYLPDVIERYVASDASGVAGLKLVATRANPLGTPPVAEILNADLAGLIGVCEFDDTKPLVDGLNKSLADMLVTSESYARPRRWAAGVEMQTNADGDPVNPFPETNRMAVSEDPETKFGQWAAANLAAYDTVTKVLVAQIQAVSALPAHYLGTLSGAPTSADGNRSAEASLASRAESKHSAFGEGIERLGQLMQGIRTSTDPLSHNVGVIWADPATRSISQEADAAVKLHAEGLLSRRAALRRLGYTDTQIDEDEGYLVAEQAMQLLEAPVVSRRAEQIEPAPAEQPAVL